MGKYSVCRTEKAATTSLLWADDLRLGWCESRGVARVQVVYDYTRAEARLVRRRGPAEQVIATGLEHGYVYSGLVPMLLGDEVVLQWRVAPSQLVGWSEVAELSLGEHRICQ